MADTDLRGEEMTLHLIVGDASVDLLDQQAWLEQQFDGVPEHPEDYDWDMASEVLFQDHDILELFHCELDGIEDPDTEANQNLAIAADPTRRLVHHLQQMSPRDGRRPFRR